VHALRRELIHGASVTQPQFVSGWDTLDRFFDQPQEPFVLCDPGDVRLRILEREDFLGHELGEIMSKAASRRILDRL
jgi:hypothetical protein